MDKIEKFLLSLSKNDREIYYKIFKDIRELNIVNYDIKPLKGYNGIFRLRKGKIRIVFTRQGGLGTVLNIAFRKDIYK